MRRCPSLLLAVLIAGVVLAGCSSTSTTSSSGPGTSGATTTIAKAPGTSGGTGTTGSATKGTSPAAGGPCPTAPIKVVVSVDQWGDIVKQLGGKCTEVTSIVTSASGDPHDYEPTPADNAKFADAKLVVVNGVDYDPWAEKAVDTLSTKPAVVNGGEVLGLKEGDNPHIWYSPDDVEKVSAAVTSELAKLSPAAAEYFQTQATAWTASMQPYRDEIAKIKAKSSGKTYAATESVFDYMAAAVGLTNATPQGYQNAAANESDPAPGDVNDFQTALKDKKIKVLIFNTQTEGAVPDQIRETATSAGVPVVNVTETVPADASSFLQWQLAQLQALEKALA